MLAVAANLSNVLSVLAMFAAILAVRATLGNEASAGRMRAFLGFGHDRSTSCVATSCATTTGDADGNSKADANITAESIASGDEMSVATAPSREERTSQDALIRSAAR